jgi:hypothetical protein
VCCALILQSLAVTASQTRHTDSPAVPCAGCAIISLTPSQALVAPEQLNHARLLLRVAAGDDPSTWRPAYDDLRRRGGRVGFHLTGIPSEADPVLLAGGDVLMIEVRTGNPDEVAYALKGALARARGQNDKTTLAVAADRGLFTALLEKDLAAYVDVLVTPGSEGIPEVPGHQTHWVAAPGTHSIGTLESAADLLSGVRLDASQAEIWLLPEDATRANATLRALAVLQSWLPAGLVAVPDRAVTCGAARLMTFLNPETLDLVAIATVCPSSASIAADVRGAPFDRLDIDDISLIRVRAGEGTRFAEGVRVTGSRELSVEEVVARHQATVARQAADIRTDIATGTLNLTFEAPGFVAPVSVTSRTVIFRSDRQTDLQQQDIRVNGVLFKANGGVPRLPIIEPERVASPPLAIALTDAYRYQLAGRETLAGRPCYIVAFTPRNRREPLYEGRAWITADTFALLRVTAVQTGLRGPITASEQTDEFAPNAAGQWLLARSDVRQTYEGAAIRTPIQRLLVIERHDVNLPDFDARRAAAYASPDVMLRDTPQGFRYLVRPPAASGDSGVPPTPVVAGRADRVRTLAFGVLVDPNISEPLPFAGLSYVDLNLFGIGAQLNVFFGGTFGQLAFSLPSVRGTRWQLGARAFGIATSYNDRAFLEGREQYSENIRQRPAEASFWALHPLTARVSFRLGYDWDYTRLEASDLTAPDFVVPANQVVHAALIGLELQRQGWQGSLWWSPALRAGWRAWGVPDSTEYQPSQHDFQRYGVSALRSMTMRPGLTTRVEVAWMSGHDLDRFSRYSFGTFDNRLHGYPSALIRYDRGGVIRTAVAWAAAKAVRLDGFADTAEVHDPGFGRGLRNYTGVGAALEAPAPFGTLLAVEWGYGLRGINTDGQVGTHVIRVAGYKVF